MPRNVIADRALAEGEVRFLAAREGDEVLAEMATLAEGVAREHGVAATFTRGLRIPPMLPEGPHIAGTPVFPFAAALATRCGAGAAR